MNRNGRSHRPEYSNWSAMKARCLNPNHKNFKQYKGRGIKVCERWRNSFDNFYADMGPKPSPKHSIERRDNDGDYEPSNCFWATQAEQRRNQRNNRLLTFDGKTQCLIDWAAETGISRQAIYRRLKRGWDVQKALTIPTEVGRNQWSS